MGIYQKTHDHNIWNEIVDKLCKEHKITKDFLYKVFAKTYPDKWPEYGRELFLSMNNKTFWREIPKAIRRHKQMLGIVPASE